MIYKEARSEVVLTHVLFSARSAVLEESPNTPA